MYNEFYKLVGEVTIPEDKKAEFNENVIRLLDRCGVRKIKRKIIDGTEVELAARVNQDKRGIVHFDYSIYENTVRDESTYDTNTCHLEVNNCGFDEMGIAMAMILTLTEAYSSTPCYVAREGKICNIEFFALITEDILGTRLRFPHRADVWTLYEFSRTCKEVKELKRLKLSEQVPTALDKIDYPVFFVTLFIGREHLLIENLKEVTFSKEQVSSANGGARDNFLYSLLSDMKRAGAPIDKYLNKLINANLEERTAYSEEESEFGKLAELSRYFPAQKLVLMYEIVMGTDYWSVWERFAKQGFYTDRIVDKSDLDEEQEHKVYHFYKAISRNNDDEALGEFSDRELDISDAMEQEIKWWREQAESVRVPDNYDPFTELKELLLELMSIYSIRKMDYDLFNELKGNPQKEITLKVLLLLREVLDKEVFLFPELTKEQAKKWIIEPCRSESEKRMINGLLGLLANKEKRMELLGF